MPVLQNPRHEAFAQAIFAGLSRHQNYSQAQAYRDAGYKVTNGNSARACASRLLTFANGVSERIHELQAEQLKRIEPEIDISKKRIAQRIDKASRIAERLDNPTAMLNSELGLAKIFHSITDQNDSQLDFKSAKSMQEIGKRLMQSVGVREPDEAMVQEAIEANDAFIARLEAIRDARQPLALER